MSRQAMVIMLLPIIIFLWTIGWSLFCLGSFVKQGKSRTDAEKNNISTLTIMQEETYQELRQR